MKVLGALVVVCAIVLCAMPVFAQDTTGRMLVRTSDAAEAPLPGVTVTIVSPSLIGGARTLITDTNGEALFLTLGPGFYEARAELHGFATQERREVWVRLGSVTALMMTMPEATFEGEIVVFDETPVVDPMQVGTEQVFDAEYIEKTAIGTWQRFVNSPGAQVPGVDHQDVLGSFSSENTWFLDGIEVTEENLGQQGRWGVATYGIDAYQEIEVKTGGYEAEYGRALGGVTSIVMKSGGNDFSGSLDTRYQADAFQESGRPLRPRSSGQFEPRHRGHHRRAHRSGPAVVLRRLLPRRGGDHPRRGTHDLQGHRELAQGQAHLADLPRVACGRLGLLPGHPLRQQRFLPLDHARSHVLRRQ